MLQLQVGVAAILLATAGVTDLWGLLESVYIVVTNLVSDVIELEVAVLYSEADVAFVVAT